MRMLQIAHVLLAKNVDQFKRRNLRTILSEHFEELGALLEEHACDIEAAPGASLLVQVYALTLGYLQLEPELVIFGKEDFSNSIRTILKGCKSEDQLPDS